MTVCAKFGKNVYLPKDAEFYFIYNGSHQRHIVIAERTEDNVLQSSIPGEACVCVCVCVCVLTLGYLDLRSRLGSGALDALCVNIASRCPGTCGQGQLRDI